jgi:hypothetical protein
MTLKVVPWEARLTGVEPMIHIKCCLFLFLGAGRCDGGSGRDMKAYLCRSRDLGANPRCDTGPEYDGGDQW